MVWGLCGSALGLGFLVCAGWVLDGLGDELAEGLGGGGLGGFRRRGVIDELDGEGWPDDGAWPVVFWDSCEFGPVFFCDDDGVSVCGFCGADEALDGALVVRVVVFEDECAGEGG